MLEFDDRQLETYREAGVSAPFLRLNRGVDLPPVEIKVGDQEYRYDRSYPIKGHSAVMPGYLQECVEQGKQPLVIERIQRYYVYLAKAGKSAPEAETPAEAPAQE